jgi:hypothetical protein
MKASRFFVSEAANASFCGVLPAASSPDDQDPAGPKSISVSNAAGYRVPLEDLFCTRRPFHAGEEF